MTAEPIAHLIFCEILAEWYGEAMAKSGIGFLILIGSIKEPIRLLETYVWGQGERAHFEPGALGHVMG